MEEIDIFSSKKADGITMDKIIEKFIPIIGALLLTVGIGYLLYTNVWDGLLKDYYEVRLGIGFIFSFAIIGVGHLFSQKLRYFADVIIGMGILLLYGTLIYGSRTSGDSVAVIPEIGSLIVSFIFTFVIAFFATARKSKVILILSMLGSYLTPFVIGQNDSWVQSISFNSYLIYFAAINILVFQMGKDIAIRNIIPLNILGLFFGTSTLYKLSYTNGVSVVGESFFSGDIFSAVLFLFLSIFSIWSIIMTSKEFEEKDEGYIAIGYIGSILWFILNMSLLSGIGDIGKGLFFIPLSVSCFAGWHFLKDKKTRYEHIALYTGGILTLILAFTKFIPDSINYAHLFISYSSLIFGWLYFQDNKKQERLISYFVLSFIGILYYFSFVIAGDIDNSKVDTLISVLTFIPPIFGYFFTKNSKNNEHIDLSKVYSLFGLVVSVFILAVKVVKFINIGFVIFSWLPLIVLIYIYTKKDLSNELKTNIFRFLMVWFVIGNLKVFSELLIDIYPAPGDTYIFTNGSIFSNMVLLKGIFACIISFFSLHISRRLKDEDGNYHPTFLVVIMAFTSLFLIVNQLIYAFANDLGLQSNGYRAVCISVWWIVLAVYMLMIGIKKGYLYRSEKLLGLILVFLTVFKIVFYDMQAVSTENKIIVLIIVGGILLLFSYFIHKKGLLSEPETEESLNKTISNIKLPSVITEAQFDVNNDKPFSTKAESLLRIVYFVANRFGKVEFNPGELNEIYSFIVNNYKTDVSEENLKKVLDLFKNFAEKGGKISFR